MRVREFIIFIDKVCLKAFQSAVKIDVTFLHDIKIITVDIDTVDCSVFVPADVFKTVPACYAKNHGRINGICLELVSHYGIHGLQLLYRIEAHVILIIRKSNVVPGITHVLNLLHIYKYQFFIYCLLIEFLISDRMI